MYKLFINNKIVYLCQNPSFVDNLMHEDFIIEPYTTKENFESTLKVILSDVNQNNVILFNPNPDNIFLEVCSFFKCVEAAGGVVENKIKEILLIHRRGSWDLPKGKIDPGETKEQTAVREVEEETGITGIELGEHIGNTYHIFKTLKSGNYFLKKTYWLKMKALKQPVKVQKEEDID